MKRQLFKALLGTTLLAMPAFAQPGGPMHRDGMDRGAREFWSRFSQEDRDAFTDARIAALRAGLRLTPDQEKLWPAVEEAIRGIVAQRRDRMGDGREIRQQLRDDFPAAIRSMADRQAARAEALRRVADATAPLYASLDESQKRRASVLLRSLRPHGMMRPDRHWRDDSGHRGRNNG